MAKATRSAAAALHPLLPFAEPMFCHSPADLGRALGEALGRPVVVAFGRSRSLPVRAATGAAGPVGLRLHRMFRHAPPAVVQALGDWLRSGRRARRSCARLDAWIDAQLALEPAPEPAPITARGRCHDLAAIAAVVVEQHLQEDFDDRSAPVVGWSRKRRSRARHTLQLGHYDPEAHAIRVHAVLDRKEVPVWYLGFLLFHEMLHAVVPSERDARGRWIHHGREFRRRERTHPDRQRAVRWEREHLPWLIRLARRGG